MNNQLIFGASLLLLAGVALTGCGASGGSPAPTEPPPEPAQLPKHGPGVYYEMATAPSGSLLRYTLLVPPAYDGETPVPLVVALHYGGEVTPFYGGSMLEALVEPGLGQLGAILVAPDATSDDWTSRGNEEAVEWLTRSIVHSYAIDPAKVALTGFSMGGEGAWFIGGRHQDLFTAVLPLEGVPAGKDVEWTIPVFVIHSTDDELIPIGPVQEHVEELQGEGALVKLRIVSGLTHYETWRYAAPLQEAVPWLQAVWPE